MKWSTLALGITIIGVLGIAALLLFQQLTTTNENDYYLLKEGTRAAMLEALDKEHYKKTGELRIDEKTFVEMFIRRYAESNTTIGDKTTIRFYDLMEEPPKVTVVIDTGANDRVFNATVPTDVQNYLSAILEIPVNNTGKKTFTKSYSYINTTGSTFSDTLYLNIPDELKSVDSEGDYIYSESVKIVSVDKVTADNTTAEIIKELAAQEFYYTSDTNLANVNNISELKNATSGISIEKEEGCNNCVKINGLKNNEKVNYKVTWRYEWAN